MCHIETRKYLKQDVGTNRILKTELSWFRETYFTETQTEASPSPD